MNKTTMWIIIIIVGVAVVAGGWVFFSKTNSTTLELGNKKSSVKSSEKIITKFNISGLSSPSDMVLSDLDHTVIVVLPNGTDIKNLTPDISVSNNAVISPASGVAQDFTKPVDYTITAEDGSTQKYTVTVKTAMPKGFSGGS